MDCSIVSLDYEAALAQGLTAFTAFVYVRFDGGSALFPLQKNPRNGQCTNAEFQSLELGVEVSERGQFAVLQLGSVAADNLQHERVAAVFDLAPVRRKASSIPAGKSSNLSRLAVFAKAWWVCCSLPVQSDRFAGPPRRATGRAFHHRSWAQ